MFDFYQLNYFTDIIRQFSPSVKGASAKVSQDEYDFVDDLNVAFLGASTRYVVHVLKETFLLLWQGTVNFLLRCTVSINPLAPMSD